MGSKDTYLFFLKETFSWKFTAAAFWGFELFPGNLWLGPGGWFHNPSLRGRFFFGGGRFFFLVFFFGPYWLVGSFDCVRFGMF